MRVKRPLACRACKIVRDLNYFDLYLSDLRPAESSGSQFLSRRDRGFAVSNDGRSVCCTSYPGRTTLVYRSTVSRRGAGPILGRGGDRFGPAQRKAGTSQDPTPSTGRTRLLDSQLRARLDGAAALTRGREHPMRESRSCLEEATAISRPGIAIKRFDQVKGDSSDLYVKRHDPNFRPLHGIFEVSRR